MLTAKVCAGVGWKNSPLSTACIGNMVKERLRQAGVYRGQTTHGTRRGKMQEDYHNKGLSFDAVLQKSQIRTPAVGKRYLDKYAHLR